MSLFHKSIMPVAAFAALAFSDHANAQATTNPAATPGSTTTLGQQIALPAPYESVTSSLGAITTSATATLQLYRSGARALVIRTALSKALLNGGKSATTITLDSTDTNASLEDDVLLCTPRQSYIVNSVSLNYLNTLVQNINTVSALPASPTDIASALALLFSSSGYSVADKVSVDPAAITALGTTALANCRTDLKSYDAAYYGTPIVTSGPVAAAVAPAAAPAAGGVDTFAFLGPVGTLIDTFLSILQPVLIDASKIVDQSRRQGAIMAALTDPATQAKIMTTGQQLASAVDNYSVSSRQSLVGSFVEQLVAIRQTPIDLRGVPDCENLAPASRLLSGAPNAAFIACWSAAWAKLKPQVDNLTALGDSYDKLADNVMVATTAKAKIGTILADFKLINAGSIPDTELPIFAADVTELITFANAVAAAASQSNIAALKAAAAAASK